MAILTPSLFAAPELNDRAGQIKKLSVSQLEDRREIIEEELSQLASYSLRSGVGAIGFRSKTSPTEFATETIEIKLEKEASIDSIVLVPAIWRDAQLGFRADSFPPAFKVIAGNGEDDVGQTIAIYDSNVEAMTRVAPFIIPCQDITASWIRIETIRLSPRSFDNKYTLQLAEIMVFSDEANIALRGTVRTSSEQSTGAGTWHPKRLVDGSLPYLMNAAHGEPSVSFVSTDIEGRASITIDLESPHLLDQIILHAVDQSDTVPQSFPGDFGFPYHLKVEGANNADFSDAKLLLDFRRDSIFEVSPIVPIRLLPAQSRHVRLTAIQPYVIESFQENGERTVGRRLGFAEIELLSNNENVALGKTAFSVHAPDLPVRSVTALTDGNNLYGEILPLHEWIGQLSRRHDLEFELPFVEVELNQRYERQKANLRILSWVVAFLVAGSIILILVDRTLRQRAVFRTKERIAADLHDELGANLHAIALLGDLAQAAKGTPEKAGQYLERIRTLIRSTSEAAKNCTNMLDTPGLYQDLIGEMKRSAHRITTDLNHNLVFENEETIERLKPRKRIDLHLFYNECLVNIIRHSDATDVETRLSAQKNQLCLTVRDNGKGLPADPKTAVPPSLKRRARLIGGQVFAGTTASGGTLITLQTKLP
jgi:signal transduction histidine kinase